MEGTDDMEPVAFVIVPQGRAGFFCFYGRSVCLEEVLEKLLGSVNGAIAQSPAKQ